MATNPLNYPIRYSRVWNECTMQRYCRSYLAAHISTMNSNIWVPHRMLVLVFISVWQNPKLTWRWNATAKQSWSLRIQKIIAYKGSLRLEANDLPVSIYDLHMHPFSSSVLMQRSRWRCREITMPLNVHTVTFTSSHKVALYAVTVLLKTQRTFTSRSRLLYRTKKCRDCLVTRFRR